MRFSLLSKNVPLGEVNGVGYEARRRPLGEYRFFAGDAEIPINEVPLQIRRIMADAYLKRQVRKEERYATA
ncbi:MAG: hypothetical protein AABX14_04375 [Candidatus Aenigmatarchaeota archaeon]